MTIVTHALAGIYWIGTILEAVRGLAEVTRYPFLVQSRPAAWGSGPHSASATGPLSGRAEPPGASERSPRYDVQPCRRA